MSHQQAYVLRQLADQVEQQHSIRTTQKDGQYIKSELEGYIPNFGDTVNRIPLDGTYECAWMSDVIEFLDHEWTDEKEYVKATYDCENFALRLAASAGMNGFNNIGIVIDWSSSHAYNIAVFGGPRDPILIEPQSDTILDPGDNDMHKLDRGVILL